MKTYYVVQLRGVPIEVFSQLNAAEHCAKERSGTWGQCEIIPTVPAQLEFEFEEPTKPTRTCVNCKNTYEAKESDYWCGCDNLAYSATTDPNCPL